MNNNITKAAELGQSIWCDYISRDLLDSGGLEDMAAQGVRGVTSNPAIFKKAMGEGSEYDGAMAALAKEGLTAWEIYGRLALEDVAKAADLMLPVHKATGGLDGYVSLEVDPHLAFDAQATVEEASKLWSQLARPNVMIKIPATDQGLRAIEEATCRGISVNATLIFSTAQSEAVGEAYIRGLERRKSMGLELKSIRSVASLFVSRLDTALDPLLKGAEAADLRGFSGVDNARLAYDGCRGIFSGSRWEALKTLGASPQRMLWASTGTKNPAYRDTLYVEELMGRDTVNTVPPATMRAFLDHGVVEPRIERDLDGALSRRKRITALGIDLEAITDGLLAQGVKAFEEAFCDLMKIVDVKIRKGGFPAGSVEKS